MKNLIKIMLMLTCGLGAAQLDNGQNLSSADLVLDGNFAPGDLEIINTFLSNLDRANPEAGPGIRSDLVEVKQETVHVNLGITEQKFCKFLQGFTYALNGNPVLDPEIIATCWEEFEKNPGMTIYEALKMGAAIPNGRLCYVMKGADSKEINIHDELSTYLLNGDILQILLGQKLLKDGIELRAGFRREKRPVRDRVSDQFIEKVLQVNYFYYFDTIQNRYTYHLLHEIFAISEEERIYCMIGELSTKELAKYWVEGAIVRTCFFRDLVLHYADDITGSCYLTRSPVTVFISGNRAGRKVIENAKREAIQNITTIWQVPDPVTA